MKLLRIFATFALSAAGLYFSPAAANAASPVVPLAIPGLKKIDYKADPVMTEYAKQAGSQAVGEWMTDFIGKKFAAKRYVLLPLAGDVDDGYFTLLARNEFTNHAAGTDYSLYTRDDDESKALIAEIRRGDQEGDTMETTTVQKFGRIQGVQGIIRGRIAGVFIGASPSPGGIRMADDQQMLQIRIVMQAFEVETGRQLWGAEKMATVLLPDDSMMIPGTKRQWVMYGAAGLLVLIVLIVFLRSMKSAHRPR